MKTIQYSGLVQDEYVHICRHLHELSYSKIIMLAGELGAGKTAFIQHFCDFLKVKDPVTSPTFALINEYNGFDITVTHMDLYRLKNIDEAYEIGLNDYLTNENYCMIEWPDLAKEICERPYIDILIQSNENSTRNILISFK